MKSFEKFLAEQDLSQQPYQAMPDLQKPAVKWKASKKEILQYWKTLRQDMPILMKPIPYSHKGSTFGEDGVRITGDPNFIAAVISRLKELLNYEGEQTKLMVSYRQTKSQSKNLQGLSKTSYVFYINSKDRGDRNPFTP